MKLADAEVLLRMEKEKGPLTERWFCETDEGVLLEAWPLGFARGSFRFEDFYTLIPHFQYSALFDGTGSPHHLKVPKMSRNHLWEQERYVYYLEMRAQMRKATENLEDAPFAPRLKEHHIQDRAPYPEDFKPGGIKSRRHKDKPGVSWYFEGHGTHAFTSILKNGFISLLENFIQGEHYGQRQAV